MTALYSIVALVLFIWSAAIPAMRAVETRSRMRFEDRMRAIQLKYSRMAYPELTAMTAKQLDELYGLNRTYREIKLRQ
jgi:hypothetical protein